MKNLMAIATISLGLSCSAAMAATCGGTYTVQPGDSISEIARDLYGSKDKWSVIYNANKDIVGGDPSLIHEGMQFHMACIDGKPTGLEGGTDVTATEEAEPITIVPGTAANKKKIALLFGDDFKPFTDRSLPNGGLHADIIKVAMDTVDPAEGYGMYWVNDWNSHLDTLLPNALLDAGVGWYQPACDVTPDAYRCENFDFSDPIFEVLILLFTNKDNPIKFTQDSDIVGKTLCRPTGYFTHDLDKNGRNWMAEGKITLKTPNSVKDCFDLLSAGEVDAVALNEFTGRTALKELGLKDSIIALDTRPLSIEGQYALIHKSHPRGKELLALINDGIRQIKASGEYQKIVDTHLARVWADF